MPSTVALFLIVMFSGFFAMVFGIVYLKTRQNLAMVEKGMNPKEFNRPKSFGTLKFGLLLIGSGLGLLVAFLLDSFALPFSVEPVGLYFALIAIGGGLGLVSSYRIEKKHWLDKQ